jgi:hypothetical protein
MTRERLIARIQVLVMFTCAYLAERVQLKIFFYILHYADLLRFHNYDDLKISVEINMTVCVHIC